MNDLVKIIIFERNTLLKGWLISTLLVLPFTFLPTVLEHGFSLEVIKFRMSDSILYSLGFSLIVVITAVIQNYNNLVDRKRLFDRPTLKKLDFYGRVGGVGSIISELETFLLGKIGNYYFRIHLIQPELNTNKIEIVPLIDLKNRTELKKKLEEEFSFNENRDLVKQLKLSEEQLNDKDYLKNILLELGLFLNELNIKPLTIDEHDLEN